MKEIKTFNGEDSMRILFHISILFEKEGKIEDVVFEKEIEMEDIPPAEMDLYLFDVPENDPFVTKRKKGVSSSCYMNKEWRGESDRPLYRIFLETCEWDGNLEKYYEWDILRKSFISDGWKESEGL
ncbi:MAG: hypothetical protein UR66_C0008G0027 [Candidatus Moranbacteria bacterium GW2011_GWE1_35_17]|nr:MAG: hypothetical protein UR66_C0008G0027 [Candidatus Moranbacteria bacterium GW2011_GWE1_35_17]KKP72253.1 MAG: hypothetical protein UR65_C0018G0003 [Candidatus Moranbacteria bacterium GW2011_GWE2_35_164]KKP82427.1 MAG: hypothetical protein UR82_C0039G0008 [Candidatus Moranbacteria bacterium GW2011_GWF1_35_5]KKP84288.1 MAG: hypothetical protein UR83_C0024G0017 [Candidatus Moranbacteria bacterium GW2011_GWF2_35_54]